MADINSIVLPDGTEYPISDYYLPIAISNPASGQVLKYDAENQVWYNGEDASGSSVLYGTSAPTSQLGTDGCLYVKYTEGTGGASDTVDALYVKLDGAWCQISTGGGGGTSDYNDLINKPQINSVELSGNKSLDDLGIQPSEISKNATGSIVTFSDGGDNIPVESFECEIVAQQASGTPTPDNPLLITGFDSADISVRGINIFDEQIEVGTLNNSTGETEVDDNKRRSANFIPVKPNTTYSVYNNTGVNLYIYSYSVDKSFIAFDNTGMVTGSTFTTDSNTYYIKFRTQNNPSYDNNISINYPSTDTQYHPYTGTIYSIDFGQTIYGGKLVYANGKWFIRATHEYISDLGALNWSYASGFFYYAMPDLLNMGNAICSVYPCNTQAYTQMPDKSLTTSKLVFSSANHIIVKDSDYTDVPTFQTAMTGQSLVYELATPVIIPLTSSVKIKTLPGVNNIFSNTGDSTLKYFTNDADGIEELINTSETSAENTTIDDTNLAYEADNVQEAFEKITQSLTYAEYQALSEEEKNNGTAYFITDVNGDGQNFQPIIYSEEEREIGVWKDGKPLYEKTIKFNNKSVTSSESTSELVHGISNIDTAFVYNAYSDFNGTEKWATAMNNIVVGSTVYNFEWAVGASVIYIKNTNLSFSASTDRSYLFVIRYTKTTDQPGSGTWTPQGVPAVHYSTDERVVGTWIDGKTLYEKTFTSNTTITYSSDVELVLNDTIPSNINIVDINANSKCLASGSSILYIVTISTWFTLYYNSTSNKFMAHHSLTSAGLASSDTTLTIRYTKSSS